MIEHHKPHAALTAVLEGYRLSIDVIFTGDETDEDGRRLEDFYVTTWEATRSIVQALKAIRFQATPERRVMERHGEGDWRQSVAVLRPLAVPPEPPAPNGKKAPVTDVSRVILAWLQQQFKEDGTRTFTVSEIAKGTRTTTPTVRHQIASLVLAGQVVTDTRPGTGKYKLWTVYRAAGPGPGRPKTVTDESKPVSRSFGPLSTI